MMAPRSLGKVTPGKPGPTRFALTVAALLAAALGGGYYAGIQPAGQWRYFSWHPLLMSVGMVGCAGVGAVIKKLGGYTNTKIHALLGSLSVLCSGAGLYVIYNNKEVNGFPHLKTVHAQAGLAVFLACVGLGAAGSVFLHPDFGIDKTNQTIRFWHKTGSRLVLIGAWFVAVLGLLQLVPRDPVVVAIYGLPLACLVPFTLM